MLVVILHVALHHPRHGVAEPLFEVSVGLEYVRHEEMHQGPELHQIVLERSSSQQKSANTCEVQQKLPSLGLEILNMLSLVKNKILPFESPEGAVILYHQFVARDADVECVLLGPANALLPP